MVVDGVAGSGFGDPAEVHDGDGVADVADDFEVVGDEQVGQAEVGLEVGEEVEYLGLDGDVEGGDWFVADDELGAQGQGAGDADALALAAGEFGGEPVKVLGVEADASHQVLDGALALGAGGGLVDGEGVADDRADPAAGVEGSVGVLEDHLDLAADRLHGAAGQVGDIAALEVDLAGGDRDQPGDAPGQGRLAAPGLADQAKRLTPPDRQRHPIDRLHMRDAAAQQAVAVDREVLHQVLDPDQHIVIDTRTGDKRVHCRTAQRLAHAITLPSDSGAAAMASATWAAR